MTAPYREGELERKLEALDARVKALEIKDNPGFRERWSARAALAREMVGPAVFASLCAAAVSLLVLFARGCDARYAEERASAGERCGAVCEAIGMHGSALEGPAPGGAIRMDCYCGLGTRLVSIRRDGTVSGIDVATGVRFGAEEAP